MSSSSNVFVYFLIIQLALLPCRADPGKIIVSPVSQTVPVGTDAFFNCTAEGNEANWVINGENCYDNCLMEREFSARSELVPPTPSSRWELNMTVPGSVQNNNTNIQCRAYKETVNISDPAYLIVMGPPSPPHLVLQPLNETTLYFNMEASFTWPQYPVLHYTITVPGLQNISELGNATEYSMLIDAADLPSLTQCEKVTVTATAHSELGESEPAVVSMGFPIAPGPFDGVVTCEVLFQSDGSPRADIRFELPFMCPYQTLNYTITLQPVNDTTASSVVYGPIHHSYADGTTIEVTLESGLVVDKVYTVTVTVENLVGSSTSNDIVSDTTFTPTAPPSPNTAPPTTTMSSVMVPNVTNTPTAESDSEGDDLLMIIIIAACGGGCFTLFVLVLVICCVLICYWRGQRRKRQEMKLHSMVPNPIYEGPLYETIGQPISTLSANGDTRESRYQDNPIYPATKEGLREYHTSVDEKLSPVYSQTLIEDNYTVMSPARVDGDSLKEDLGMLKANNVCA